MRLFKWLSPVPPPARLVVQRPPCWVLDCTEQALARLDLDVRGLPREAEVCEYCDLAIRFNIQNPESAGLASYGSDVAMGSEADGWVVAGLFLVRPTGAAVQGLSEG